uniref:LY6/PLAUR domain containing 3 n=1 Tax=Panthera tigris altaica TaxID=74533 RepID=A0A8C9KJE0_PANTA
MDPARKAGAQAVIWTTGWLLLLSLLLGEGARALQCYSCVQKADDGCSPQKTKTVKCAPGVDVCTEAAPALRLWPGYRLAVAGGGGGGRGPLAGNESAYPSNGAECYSCVGLSHKACRGTAPPVVSCYNASERVYKGCFDANVTVSLPVRGCVQDEFCTRDAVTGPGFTLSGSCCQGSRCNSDLHNKTFFSPRIPPLVLLPPPKPTTQAPTTSVTTSTPAPTTLVSATKPTTASQTSPQEVHPETSQKEESGLAGGAAGHQDRRNMGQHPTGGGAHNKGSSTSSAGLAALVLALAAGTLP